MKKRTFKLPIIAVILVALALTFGACSASSTTTTIALDEVKWTLESFGQQGNLKSPLEGTEITATFESNEGQVRGSSGCNSYFGKYEVNGDKLTIQEMAWTEMACLEPEGVMEQETEYLSILSKAVNYQIKDGKLQIDSGDQMLVFVAP